jgi:hypothetical protein
MKNNLPHSIIFLNFVKFKRTIFCTSLATAENFQPEMSHSLELKILEFLKQVYDLCNSDRVIPLIYKVIFKDQEKDGKVFDMVVTEKTVNRNSEGCSQRFKLVYNILNKPNNSGLNGLAISKLNRMCFDIDSIGNVLEKGRKRYTKYQKNRLIQVSGLINKITIMELPEYVRLAIFVQGSGQNNYKYFLSRHKERDSNFASFSFVLKQVKNLGKSVKKRKKNKL